MLLLESRLDLQRLEDNLAGVVEGSTSVAVLLICTPLLDKVCWS
jgi:hypothetical protein